MAMVLENRLDDAVGGIHAVVGKVVPDLLDIHERFRMER